MRDSTRTAVLCGVLISLAGAATAAAAGPDADDVSGTVVASSSRWGHAGNTIITATTVETASGESVVVHQLGGRVGDVAMRVTHTPPIAPVGASVIMRVTEARSLDGRPHQVLTQMIEMSALPPGTSGFVRTTTDAQNAPLFWESGCAQVAMHDAGAAAITAADEVEAITDSVAEWTQNIASCASIDLRFSGLTPIEPGFDGFNVIRFREDRWCRPASGADPEICHDPAAAGLTFLTFAVAGERAGAILDADIELNGVNFGLLYNGAGDTGASCGSDIPNTLVHELGHFLGLDHTCWDGRGTRPVDDEGDPVPSCGLGDQIPAEARDATMYAFQDCGETSKATLEADDIAGVCAIYPAASDPGECSYPDISAGGFCSSSGDSRGSAWVIMLALCALAISSRRRSGRRASDAVTNRVESRGT